MDLFEALPGRPDIREGWVQVDLFFAAAEAARETRLQMTARPRISPVYRQAPLLATVTIPCGIGNCRRRFSTPGRRVDHVLRQHPKPSAEKPAPAVARTTDIVAETADQIRARIRARMTGAVIEAGEDRRGGEEVA